MFQLLADSYVSLPNTIRCTSKHGDNSRLTAQMLCRIEIQECSLFFAYSSGARTGYRTLRQPSSLACGAPEAENCSGTPLQISISVQDILPHVCACRGLITLTRLRLTARSSPCPLLHRFPPNPRLSHPISPTDILHHYKIHSLFATTASGITSTQASNHRTVLGGSQSIFVLHLWPKTGTGLDLRLQQTTERV